MTFSFKRGTAVALVAGIALALTGPARAGEPAPIEPALLVPGDPAPTDPALLVPASAEVGAVDAAAPEGVAVPVVAPPMSVLAEVDLSDQTMRIFVDGQLAHEFVVSTGRKGYSTPTGEWGPEWLSRYHRSKKYHNAPMPWAVFFYGGYAVHGTDEIKRLGKPASHGCVRLHPDNAKFFFKLVQEVGKENVRIAIVQ